MSVIGAMIYSILIYSNVMSINFGDIAILNIKRSDYRCLISLITKNEAI